SLRRPTFRQQLNTSGTKSPLKNSQCFILLLVKNETSALTPVLRKKMGDSAPIVKTRNPSAGKPY
ncbi:hypothetical protein OLN68_06100, partial [Citrobacter freundii]|nr:hypothetical protein [Citrobacter freundii]MCW1445226.1 hypothetical protein [Citrobacter freundii]